MTAPAKPEEPIVPTPQDKLVIEKSTNERGIAEVKFIECVEDFCTKWEPFQVRAGLQDLHAKYKYTESQLIAQKAAIDFKIPEAEKSAELVDFLIQKRKKMMDEEESTVVETKYCLAENIHSTADIDLAKDEIWLWLGANCIMQYSFEEAQKFLYTSLKNASLAKETNGEDLLFVKDQITTTEVLIARFHNYGISLKTQKEADENAAKAAAGGQEE